MTVVVVAHLLVGLALVHAGGPPESAGRTSVVTATIVEAVPAERQLPPMATYTLRFSVSRPELPVPDVVVREAQVAAVVPAVISSESASGAIHGTPQPSAVATGPRDVQQVQYAQPILLDYPPASRRLNETGVVLVRVVIDEKGVPVEVVVQRSSGYPRLDAAAAAAVRRAMFRPYRENGIALPARAVVPVRFELG